MSELSNTLVEEIFTKVENAFRVVSSRDLEQNEAKIAHENAKDASGNAREKFLIEISEAADAGKWEGEYIDVALEKAKARRNDQKGSSIATFATDLRNAMRPGVRGNVRQMFATASEIWNAEAKAKPGDKKPLRSAFQRRYHMVVGPMFEAAKGGVILTGADMIERAEAKIRERELDHTKAWKALKAMHEQLVKFNTDFPGIDGIDMAKDFLGELLYTEKDGKQVPYYQPFKDALKRQADLRAAQSAPETEPEVAEPEVEPEPMSREDAYNQAIDDIYGVKAAA